MFDHRTQHLLARLRPLGPLLAALLACDVGPGDDAAAEGEAAGSNADAADSGASQPTDCDANVGDGVTQCTLETCAAGSYCEVDGICSSGCRSSLNCGSGESCDLRAPAPNADHTFEIGVCRVPGPWCGVATGASDDDGSDSAAPSCEPVQGNYAMFLDTDSPSACDDAFSGLTMCSVAQDGCALTWGCDTNFGLNFPPGLLDGNVYQGSGMIMGVPFACTVEFAWTQSSALTFSCSANFGQAVVCNGWGV